MNIEDKVEELRRCFSLDIADDAREAALDLLANYLLTQERVALEQLVRLISVR